MTRLQAHNATQQVFERVLARPVDAPDLHHGRLIHLAWRAPQQGQRLVQFYLNGRLSGATLSVTQREAWLVIDHEQHTQIELLAVRPSSATVDLADGLAGVEPATQPAARFTALRDHALPAQTSLTVSVSGGARTERVPLSSPHDARGGFGAVFGEGGFGYDASTGPGLGLGELGPGPLGTGGDALRWRSEALARGSHTIGLSLGDHHGVSPTPALSLALTIDRLPDPPADAAINHELKLTWN